MRLIKGCEVPKFKREVIARLEQNVKDQSLELEMLKDAVAYYEHELDLTRVTLALLNQQ